MQVHEEFHRGTLEELTAMAASTLFKVCLWSLISALQLMETLYAFLQLLILAVLLAPLSLLQERARLSHC